MPIMFQHGLTGERREATTPEERAWYEANPPWYLAPDPKVPQAYPPKPAAAKPATKPVAKPKA